MLNVPIFAFVFKNFIRLRAFFTFFVSLRDRTFFFAVTFLISGNLYTAENLPATNETISIETPSQTEKHPSKVIETKKILEPIREHENEPYKFPLEDDRAEEVPEDHFFGQFMKMLATLGVLIAIMLTASWSLKRMLNTSVKQLNESSLIKIVEKRSLSNKSSIYLIEVQGKNYMLGESMHTMTLLATLDDFPEDT